VPYPNAGIESINPAKLGVLMSFFHHRVFLPVSSIMVFISCQAQAGNLIKNGSFENSLSPWVWSVSEAKATGKIDRQEHHTGRASFRMTNASAAGPNICASIYQVVEGLKPNTTYHIGLWCKGKGVGAAWFPGGAKWDLRTRLPYGTYPWRYVSTEYTTGLGETSFVFRILMENEAKGLWIDDVRFIEKVEADAIQKKIKTKINSLMAQAQLQIKEIKSKIQTQPALKSDPYINLGLTIAERFIRRVETSGPDGKQDIDWSVLQTNETLAVVKQMQDRVDGLMAGTGPVYRTVSSLKDQPEYFYGYGHFSAVVADIPVLRTFGANLISIDSGPRYTNPDGLPNDDARSVIATVQSAGKHQIKVDVILSPHNFPAWAFEKYPEVKQPNDFGFIHFNIDHPRAREVIQKWLENFVPMIKDEPALLSLGLTNEPSYSQSGRDKFSRPLWFEYLKSHHQTIETLNSLYGTHYKNFNDVPVPNIGMPKAIYEQRVYYDWVRFNQDHFIDWHRWMNKIVKEKAPNVMTHTKILDQGFDRTFLHQGQDAEAMSRITDWAGNDSTAYPIDGINAYDWQQEEMWYDLLHSFKGQPVFNSENHFIPDDYPPLHVPPAHTRAVLWQGALHHQTMTVMWVWEEPLNGALRGSIYLRPANIYAAGKTMFDIHRLTPELNAINLDKPQIAILYSTASIFWQEDYCQTVKDVYTNLMFMGLPVTFVSERQLVEGKYPATEWIIVPQATHVLKSTIEGLKGFAKKSGKLLLVGKDNLRWNEYHREQVLPADLITQQVPKPQDVKASLVAGKVKLVGLKDNQTGKPAWGVEFRVVSQAGRCLVPMINQLSVPQTVTLDLKGTAIDLITEKSVELNKIRLEPMEPILLLLEIK
jgi:hypothetical protein